MKTILGKLLVLILCGALLVLPAAALGEARYPAQSGAVTDDANALGKTMAQDVAAYAEKLADATEVNLHVALVLFLDGEPVQTYADTLFTRWQLGENDLLLLGAAAEDTFALASGTAVKAKLSDASLKTLLYGSGFADAFQQQRYDEAFGRYLVAFNDLANKQYSEQIALGTLFAAYQPAAQTASQSTQNTAQTAGQAMQGALETAGQAVAQATQAAGQAVAGAAQTAADVWSSAVNAVSQNVATYQDYHTQRNESERGLSPTGWIVLAVLVLIIFGQSGPARRARRAGGCGCSPLGWIIGGLGLGALFGRHGDRGERFHRGRYW